MQNIGMKPKFQANSIQLKCIKGDDGVKVSIFTGGLPYSIESGKVFQKNWEGDEVIKTYPYKSPKYCCHPLQIKRSRKIKYKPPGFPSIDQPLYCLQPQFWTGSRSYTCCPVVKLGWYKVLHMHQCQLSYWILHRPTSREGLSVLSRFLSLILCLHERLG